MARFFIDRPVFAIVLSLFITLSGLLALGVLPIAQYPQITLPTINVSTQYIGASADVVRESVAQVVQDKVNGVEGMLYMDSQSTGNGLYSQNVTFGLDKDADMESVLTQNRVTTATPSRREAPSGSSSRMMIVSSASGSMSPRIRTGMNFTESSTSKVRVPLASW